jgi:hypothetical protein
VGGGESILSISKLLSKRELRIAAFYFDFLNLVDESQPNAFKIMEMKDSATRRTGSRRACTKAARREEASSPDSESSSSDSEASTDAFFCDQKGEGSGHPPPSHSHLIPNGSILSCIPSTSPPYISHQWGGRARGFRKIWTVKCVGRLKPMGESSSAG